MQPYKNAPSCWLEWFFITFEGACIAVALQGSFTGFIAHCVEKDKVEVETKREGRYAD